MANDISFDEAPELREESRKKICHAKDRLANKVSEDPETRWLKEFTEAERVVIAAEQAHPENSLYDTDYQSIEDDLTPVEKATHVPLNVYSMTPISVAPYRKVSATSLGKRPALTERQKEFCKFMRQKIIVVLSHFASEKDFEEKRVSSLQFSLCMLPDSHFVEDWILPSHRPIAVPLYILRHFGILTQVKKMPIYEFVEKTPATVKQEVETGSGFTFGSVFQPVGMRCFVQFNGLSDIRKSVESLSRRSA